MAFNPLNWLLGLFSLDISVDLGTANTLVSVRGKGIVINEPSWVAVDKRSRRPLAIGSAAKEMVGRTPANVLTLRPLRDGVISDFEVTQAMLEYFIGKAHEQSVVPVPRPRVIVGVPCGATEVEKRAVFDAALSAGAREAFLVEEPTAAAMGAGLPLRDTRGSMIMDIGGGTTEVAIFSIGTVVASQSIRVAGDEMDENIIAYLRDKYNLLVGAGMAEQAKLSVGSAFAMHEEKVTTVRGRNLITGLPEEVEISSIELREAIAPSVKAISEVLREILDKAPPEIMADLLETGLCVSGGGALLQGIPERLSEEFHLRVWRAEDPLTCVVRGAASILENLESERQFLASLERPRGGR